MSEGLRVTLGQHSQAGRKSVNQDFHGAVIPVGSALATKGIAIALADGIGSSEVSHLASAMAVKGFLEDYYATTEAWPVRRAAQRVLAATNAWLHAQTLRSDARFDKDRGLVCTFSALILKGREAHSLHVGDARIYRLHGHALEPLTDDHRVRVSSAQSYLARALGAGPSVDIDYRHWPTERGEVYLLATDGAHEYLDAGAVHAALATHPDDFDAAAAALTGLACERGSPDDLTVQLVRIDALPLADVRELHLENLAPPPVLAPRMNFEGYFIVRELHISPRSHVWLALDEESGVQVVLKTPSVDLGRDPAQRDRLLLEDWVARRIDSPHVLKPSPAPRPRRTLYSAMEYIEGQTLSQWMVDHPRPALSAVRDIIEQVAKGLQAFHGKEMLHQDLRPENVMIDRSGTAKIIDFGSVHVPGLVEGTSEAQTQALVGTLQYAAPEYFVGTDADARSDLFSLAVLTYQMLCGHLPYGLQVTRVRFAADLARLRYADLRTWRPDLPAWLDAVLRKALQAQPGRRQQAVSELVHDLRSPGPAFLGVKRPPLLERSPVAFWRTASVVLAALVVLLLALLLAGR